MKISLVYYVVIAASALNTLIFVLQIIVLVGWLKLRVMVFFPPPPFLALLSGRLLNGVNSRQSLIFFMILLNSQLCLDPQLVSHKIGRFQFYESERLNSYIIET